MLVEFHWTKQQLLMCIICWEGLCIAAGSPSAKCMCIHQRGAEKYLHLGNCVLLRILSGAPYDAVL